MINKFKNPNLDEAVRSLMLLGEDGTTFVYFSTIMGQLDRQAAEGDAAAMDILRRVIGVGNLVRDAKTLVDGPG
jgi:hypothetical protein